MSARLPDGTSINYTELKPDAYVFPFAPELVDLILNKHKVTTYRFGLKYDYLEVGDKVNIQNSSSKEVVARARIAAKGSAKFTDLPVRQEFRDQEHHREVLSGYYAYLGRPIADDDLFLMFDFELIRQ